MQRAALIMFVAMSLIPAGDSAGKLLSSSLGVAPVFVAWSRFVLGALMVLPFIAPSAFGLLRDWRVWLRALVLACGISSIQTALQTADIATVFAAFFIGPIFSYVLAVLFLREPVTPLRSLLIVVGFAGVLLVVRPGMGGDPGVIWAAIAGLCYGTFLTMSRWLSGIGTPIALTFTQLLLSAFFLLPLGLMNLPDATLPIAALTLTSAFCSMMGNLLLLYAYRIANATRLAPLVYFQLIAAVGFGWSIFGDLPDAYTWAGLAIILASGIASTRLR
ncbi:DMT family transporter [Sulfitobacter geojensis]|uniref:DMT family transporter n=1 Tax=Sulfitobacter geojensis TaxID=1342299 RepID=A0AAE2VZJ4_9RHOB|nr:DMT family transporter [Sulfitobacter geojensis]MBM1690405.1 DMT family transporter [Sulfitobacter geojensis]MBM1694471.1 DMT family transporter [Sulfitobacter geojensis]MBM1706637.1 DMT family transporter [Sulfitobacter geojensis]MBM1710695.1 DMT family transporter [Sulfitobacter geojensis]MBM1714761.1 DMT family transporter [Sulfitobacter geojensis]